MYFPWFTLQKGKFKIQKINENKSDYDKVLALKMFAPENFESTTQLEMPSFW